MGSIKFLNIEGKVEAMLVSVAGRYAQRLAAERGTGTAAGAGYPGA